MSCCVGAKMWLRSLAVALGCSRIYRTNIRCGPAVASGCWTLASGTALRYLVSTQLNEVAMTIANEPAPPASKEKLALRPRPPLGLGAALIGKEEEELVLQVLRNQEPFRYYGHDEKHPPGMAAALEKDRKSTRLNSSH